MRQVSAKRSTPIGRADTGITLDTRGMGEKVVNRYSMSLRRIIREELRDFVIEADLSPFDELHDRG